MVIISPSQALGALRNILSDPLYRGSVYLLANTVVVAVIGFVFWTLAAHRYSAPTVGVFSGVTSGAGLLAAIAALGLPITMTRHIAGAKNPRELILTAMVVIATVGTVLCLATIFFLGPHLPPALHIQQRGKIAFLLTVLVVFSAAGTTFDAGLVATRDSRVMLIKNSVASVVRLVAVFLLATFRSSGLLISFGLGLVLATVLGGVALGRRTRAKEKRIGFTPFHLPWQYLSISSGYYLATVIGILPLTVVPIEVLAARGPAETAHFSVAFLIAGFLNFIPSTIGQVLFAEIARGGVPIGRQLRKAFRAVYGLLLPSLVFLFATAPIILRLFGQGYATDTVGCLRVLILSALPAGGTYLICSLLIARDQIKIYTFMQIANAALILGFVGMLLPRGLTAAAGGLALGQGLTLVLCLLVLPASSVVGRHHLKVSPTPAGKAPPQPQRALQSRSVLYTFEPQIRELLATWPMMPTALIAERIGWDESIQSLLDLVAELRLVYMRAPQDISRSRYLPGETAQCGLWLPPTEIPVGFRQTRSAQQLPVLTMITSYSRWLTATLIPSTHARDLFAGLWELLTAVGAVPSILIWDNIAAIGRWEDGRLKLTSESTDFCRALGTRLVVGRPGDPKTRGLIEQAQAFLESSFLSDRTFASPVDFNVQLGDWLKTDNTRRCKPPSLAPIELINADKEAMLPLPPVPPPRGWHLSMKVGSYPFVRFDSNAYSLHPSAIGHRVDLFADLARIKVICDGKPAASHERCWAREQTIRDPAHFTASGRSATHTLRRSN